MDQPLNPTIPSRIAARIMRHATIAITAAVLAATSFSTGGVAETPTTTSPYTGQENRSIKSLSAEDLSELKHGGGWGLARAAELNGMPGPAHLLELKDRIPLTADQVTAISAIFKDMRAAAITEGERFISREEALETAFRNGSLDVQSLQKLLSEVGQARMALRYVHLVAHLKTLPLLSHDQIARYNVLRGYAGDPCASPPEGHDVSMWRKHNGCD
ncbi:MAG: hypothetical protein OXI81_06300 [Paracoccaceae bacterium]|nr:hypothetical protein [Paracoccaceae bacterium]